MKKSVKLTSKGQISIPKKIRNILHLETGDNLISTLTSNGEILLKKDKKSILNFAGCLHKYKKEKPISIEEKNEIILSNYKPKN